MRIESGPARQWITRLLLLFAIIEAAAWWFAYDGWIGWPAAKREYRLRGLDPAAAAAIRVDERVTSSLGGRTAAELKAALPDLVPVRVGGDLRYDGPNGYLLIAPDSKAKWNATWKRESEIELQKIIAMGLGIVSLGVLLRFVLALRTRVVLDDEGLRPAPTQLIPYAQMTRLATERLREKGWVEVVYSDGGAEKRCRIDSYHLAQFNAVVEALCQKKGWPTPASLSTS